MSSLRLLLIAPLLVAGLEACAAPSPHERASSNAVDHEVGEALGALASCFGPNDREPDLDALRPKLLSASLVPSRVFDDETVWTSHEGETRGLGLRGFRAEGRYRAAVSASPPDPVQPGDYQGWLGLRRVGPGEFEWSSAEQVSLGPLPLGGLSDVVSDTLRAADTSAPGDLRPVLKRVLPRSAKAFGRGFVLEALQLERGETASTAVVAGARLDLESLAEEFPRYATFLRSYVLPIRLGFEIDDGDGGVVAALDGRDGRFTLRARIRDGRLVSLTGSPRPAPDRLRLRVDLTSRAGPFRYGMQGLEADVRVLGRPGERKLEAVFDREPDWVIPFVAKPFLRSSLRRPFEGDGALLAYAIRESGSGTTTVSREYRIAVKESWLVRWIGGNTGDAVASFRESAEAEAERFWGEALLALRADVVRLLGGR